MDNVLKKLNRSVINFCKKIIIKIKQKSNIIKNNKLLLWLFLSIATFFTFFLPSLLFSIINNKYHIIIDSGSLILFIPLAFLLSCVRNIILYTILSLFVILELVQFGYMSYFGLPLNAFVLEIIFSEMNEILQSGFAFMFKIWYFPFIVIIPYFLLFYIYKNTDKYRKKFLFPVIFIICLCSYYPKRVLDKNTAINNMMPSNTSVSLYNDFKIFSGFFFNRLPKLINNEKSDIINKYSEYTIDSFKNIENINIIVIIGESVNRDHMSLYGYKRNTSPLLKSMSLTDKNFMYKKAYSSSVLTTVSTNMFFNIRREPDNLRQLFSQKTNLFNLAKNNGFETFYISAQAEGLLNNLSPEKIDKIITKEKITYQLNKTGEIYLIESFKKNKKNFKNKNFIVIHQRNIHSPYENNYKNEEKRFGIFSTEKTSANEYRINSYDNAMLYNDYFLYSLLNAIKSTFTTEPTYVFFISDHSESLGKNGKFGHSFLDEEVAKIPFITTFFNIEDEEFKKEIDNLFYPTHYEIGKIIAKKLGYKIINKNEDNKTFFINGVNINGEAGFITINKNLLDKTIDLK